MRRLVRCDPIVTHDSTPKERAGPVVDDKYDSGGVAVLRFIYAKGPM